MRLPPRWLRRFVLWPLPVIGLMVYAATVPLLITLALIWSYRLPGKMRAVRSLGLATVYLFVEAFVVVTSFVLWVLSGFGWKLRSELFVRAHYGILRLALRALVSAGRRLFSLSIRAEEADLAAEGGNGAPLVVMSRHAGPADSILLLHEVMSWRGRRPRIVAKDLLQLDPSFDILLNRLPNRFVSPNGGRASRAVEAISELAGDMTSRDAFVIFPEGGNFTPQRRLRAIDRLRRDGHVAAAERAAGLRNVLPPRPAGTKAALAAAPHADAVFVAHTGLDTIATVGDLWNAIPDHKVLEMKWHVVPAGTIPLDDVGREEMLYAAWDAIDAWIATCHSA